MTESIIQHIENKKQPYRVPVFAIKPTTIHFSDKVEKQASVIRLTTCDFVTNYYNISFTSNCLRWIRIPEYDTNDLLASQFGKTPENPYFKTHNNSLTTPILCKLYITPGAYENIVDIFSEINSKLYDSFVDLFKIHTNPTSVFTSQQFKYQYAARDLNPGDAENEPMESFIPSIFTKWGCVELTNSVAQTATLSCSSTDKVYYYIPGTIRYEKDNIQYTLKNSIIAFTTTTIANCSLINSTIELPYFTTINEDDDTSSSDTQTIGNRFNVTYLNQMYNIYNSTFSSSIVSSTITGSRYRNAVCNILKNGIIGDIEEIRCYIWNNGKQVVTNSGNINIESATLSSYEDVSDISKFKDRFEYQTDDKAIGKLGSYIYRYADEDIIMNEDLTITLSIPSAVISEIGDNKYSVSFSENASLTIFNSSGTSPIALDGFISTCAQISKYPNVDVFGRWIEEDKANAPTITFINNGAGKIQIDGKASKVDLELKGTYDGYSLISEPVEVPLSPKLYFGTRTVKTETQVEIVTEPVIGKSSREYTKIENNGSTRQQGEVQVPIVTETHYYLYYENNVLIKQVIDVPTTRDYIPTTDPDVDFTKEILVDLSITSHEDPNDKTLYDIITQTTTTESLYGPPTNPEDAKFPEGHEDDIITYLSSDNIKETRVSAETENHTWKKTIYESIYSTDEDGENTTTYNLPTLIIEVKEEPVNPGPKQKQTLRLITTTKVLALSDEGDEEESNNDDETIVTKTYKLYHHDFITQITQLEELVKMGYAVRVKKLKYPSTTRPTEINNVYGIDILPVKQDQITKKWSLDDTVEAIGFNSLTVKYSGTSRSTTYYDLEGEIERYKYINGVKTFIDYPIIDRKFTISTGDCSAGIIQTTPASGTALSNLFIINDATSTVKEVRSINENVSITYDTYFYKAYRLIMEKQSSANFISLITADENSKLAIKFFTSVVPVTSSTIYTSTVDFLNVLQDPNFNLKFNTLHLEPIIEFDDITKETSLTTNNFKLSKYSQQNNNVDDFYYNFAIDKTDLWSKLGFVPNVIQYDKSTIMSYNSKNKADESDSIEQVYPVYTIKGVYYSETLYQGPIYTPSVTKLESYEQNLNSAAIRKIILPENYNIIKLLDSTNNTILFNTYFNKTTHYAQRLMNLSIPKTIEVKLTQNKDIEEYLNSNEIVDSIANIGQYQVVRDNQTTIASIQQQLVINSTIEIPDEKTIYVFLTNGNQIYSLMDTVATLNVEYIN